MRWWGLFLKVDDVHVSLNDFWLAGMFSFVLADFAGVVVKMPRLSDFGCHQFDDDIHRHNPIEVVGEVCADTK